MAKQKKEILSYDSAMAELQSIVSELQSEAVGIDQLSEKVKRAAVLIQWCKLKLRNTSEDIDQLMEE